MEKNQFLKGNEAIAEAAILAGIDAYFGYPITPQTEIMEYMIDQNDSRDCGVQILQAESEVAAINMVYGAASAGRRVMTSTSSPGLSLMMEGISYIAGAELPCVIVNVARGGPGLGTIQPAQSDYFQVVKGGGHGDYKMLVLAPASVQEMADFVAPAFEIAFKYRNPVMILSDGVIGQMMERVVLPDPVDRITTYPDWATTGKKPGQTRRHITSLNLEPLKQEAHNLHLQSKYRRMQEVEVRFEMMQCEDADYVLVAYGASARIAQKTMQLLRQRGVKVGIFRPITLFPFPSEPLFQLASSVKGFLAVEMSCGQMVEDVQLAVKGRARVEHYGRMGGLVHAPEDILQGFETLFLNA